MSRTFACRRVTPSRGKIVSLSLLAISSGRGATRAATCGEVPAVGVDHEHAVAVAFDAAVDDVVLQVGDAGDGDGDFDALVEGGDVPACRPRRRSGR